MDPLTQGLVGATLAQAVARDRRALLWAGGFGFLAGILPDLDVLIRSTSDPLLFLEYHRQFTHSLLMVPLGGLLCAVVFHSLLARRSGLTFRTVWLYCTLGWGTHGLLDAFTSYGTMLWWPFDSERIALSLVSVVDPLFTVPILVLVIVAAWLRQPRFAAIALLWGGLYLGAGLLQRQAAAVMGASLAASRGHVPVRLEAKPSFANIVIWKIVYEAGDRFYVDAVRATLLPRVFEGGSTLKLDIDRDFPELDLASQQRRDIARFARLSEGFLARDASVPSRIVDVRYSMVPNEIDGLWSVGVRPDAGPDGHVTFQTHRGNPRDAIARLWSMLTAPAQSD